MKTKNKKLYRVIQASQCFDSLLFPAAFKMVVYGLGRGDDRMFVLYAPRTANNKPREVITRRDFAQIGRVINSCGQSALPPLSTAKLSRRPEPSRFPLFVAALCGFVARTNHGKDILIPKRRRSGLQRLLIRVSRVRAPAEPEIPMTNNGCDGDRSSTMLVKTTPLLSPSRSSFRSGRHSNWRTGGKQKETRSEVSRTRRSMRAVPLRSSQLYSTCSSRYTHVCKRTCATMPPSRYRETVTAARFHQFQKLLWERNWIDFSSSFFAVKLHFSAKTTRKHGNDFIPGIRRMCRCCFQSFENLCAFQPRSKFFHFQSSRESLNEPKFMRKFVLGRRAVKHTWTLRATLRIAFGNIVDCYFPRGGVEIQSGQWSGHSRENINFEGLNALSGALVCSIIFNA